MGEFITNAHETLQITSNTIRKAIFWFITSTAFIENYKAVSKELKTQDSGATAVNFLIKAREIFAANFEDARAIKGKTKHTTLESIKGNITKIERYAITL